MGKHILIVEDEDSVIRLWHRNLQRKGYQLSIANWDNALAEAKRQQPNLIVVDLSLPAKRCLPRCQKLASACHAAVLLVVDQMVDSLQQAGLEVITRPVRFRTLLQCIEDILARLQPEVEKPQRFLRAGDICLDIEGQKVSKGDQQHSLTAKQLRLLLAFMTHPGQVLTREQLMKEVWETDYVGDTRTLYVHIRWLRQKIEKDPSNPTYLRTVRGIGYCFNVPD